MACIHGYPDGDCMICRTLEPAPSAQKTKTRRRDQRAATDAARPPATVVDHAPHGRGGRTALHALVLVGLLAIAVVSFFLITSVLYAIFHLIELLLVAGVAGALGYRIGKSRGRRER